MTTYMTHPDHGVHLAYTPDEIKRCEENGWTVYGNEPPKPGMKIAPAVDFHDKPKRGRPRKSS